MREIAQTSPFTVTPTVRGLQRLILRRVWSALWRHLPMLAVGSTVTTLGASVGFWLAGGSQIGRAHV